MDHLRQHNFIEYAMTAQGTDLRIPMYNFPKVWWRFVHLNQQEVIQTVIHMYYQYNAIDQAKFAIVWMKRLNLTMDFAMTDFEHLILALWSYVPEDEPSGPWTPEDLY